MDGSVRSKSKIQEDGKKTEGGKEESVPPSTSVQSGSHSWKPHEASAEPTVSLFAMTHFDIREMIPVKFTGENGEFAEFSLRLKMADSAMSKLGYSYPQRLLHLLKVLDGPALQYVQDLPLTSPESYTLAINTLTSLFSGQQSVFKEAVLNALSIPKCGEDYGSRSALHAGIVQFFNIALSQCKSAEEALFGTWMTIFEQKLDTSTKKEWMWTCTKNRASNALNHDRTIDNMEDVIFRTMLSDLHARASGSADPRPTTQRVSWTRR